MFSPELEWIPVGQPLYKYIRAEAGAIIDINKGVDFIYFKEDGIARVRADDVIGTRNDAKFKVSFNLKDLCDVFVKKSKEPGNPYYKTGDDVISVFDLKYEKYKEWFDSYDYWAAIWVKQVRKSIYLTPITVYVLKPVASLTWDGYLELLN